MNKKIGLITAAMLHCIAIIYVCVMDTKLVQTHQMKWDSSLGHILMTPAVLMVCYGWLMSIVLCFKLPQLRVGGEDGDWSAQTVFVPSKFHHSTLYQLLNTNR